MATQKNPGFVAPVNSDQITVQCPDGAVYLIVTTFGGYRAAWGVGSGVTDAVLDALEHGAGPDKHGALWVVLTDELSNVSEDSAPVGTELPSIIIHNNGEVTFTGEGKVLSVGNVGTLRGVLAANP